MLGDGERAGFVELLFEDSVSSTNDRVLEIASARGVVGPVALRAGEQLRGRGRLGRGWVSPRGGVWVSVAWPCRADAGVYEGVPVIAGLCIVEQAIESGVAAEELSVKWPNDVLGRGRKLAGVLCERPAAGPGGASWLVVGMGVNGPTPEARGPGVGIEAIGLQEGLGIGLDPGAFASGLVARLDSRLRGLESDPAGVLEETRQALGPMLAFQGEPVRLMTLGNDAPLVEGMLRGLDDRLRLLVESGGGEVRAVSTGEVERVRPRAAGGLEMMS